MKYALSGKRPQMEVPEGEVRHKPDGYTEIWREGRMVALYMTEFLVEPDRKGVR